MAQGRFSPKHPKSFAAEAAIFLSAVLFSLPALASSSTPIPCPLSDLATLEVLPGELMATKVSNDISYLIPVKDAMTKTSGLANPTSLLAPRAEAAIREVFRDSTTGATRSTAPELAKAVVTPPMVSTASELDESDDADEKRVTPSAMKTRLPGVSDDDLSRFKKQMFRRDI